MEHGCIGWCSTLARGSECLKKAGVMEWKKRAYLRNVQGIRLSGSITSRGEDIARGGEGLS